jgi:hypothetical protein
MHAHEMFAHKMHAHEMHAREMQTLDMQAYTRLYVPIRCQNHDIMAVVAVEGST